MYNTSLFPCIMTMMSNFSIFFILKIFILCILCIHIFLCKYNRLLHFYMIPAALLFIIHFFLKKIIFMKCSLKDSQNLFKQYLPLYTSCFSVLLNEDIVHTEKPDGIFLLILLKMNFQDYFYIHQSFLLYIQDMHK